MDREERRLSIRSFFNRITPEVEADLENQAGDILYNVIGFISVSDFADNGNVIANVGGLIAEKNLNTCIVDFKVFYPTLYNYVDVLPNERGKGLLSVLKNDKIDIRTQINETKYKQLYLLSPSPYDLIEEYVDFKISDIERLLEELKEIFDIVLIDIPNNPPLEFCLAAMKYVHRGFITVSERIESIQNATKLLEFANSVGVSTAKFTNLIYVNGLELSYDYGAIKETDFKIAAKLPMVKGAIEEYFKGNLYVKHSSMLDKQYLQGIQQLVEMITN